MLTNQAIEKLRLMSEPSYYAPEKKAETKMVAGTPVKTIQVGSSGTNIYSGYITEDYLAELRGTKAMKIYDKMRRSDPRIKMVSSAVKNPIKSADWIIRKKEGVLDSPLVEEQEKLMRKILFGGLKKSWKKTLHEILSMVDFGHAELEITHQVILKDKNFGPHIAVKSLKLIGQKTVERFNVSNDGDLISVTQYASGDVGRNATVAAEFVLHFAIDKEGDNYEGISMLRPCYGPWLRKNNALKQESVGNQNFSTPIAVMSVPDGEQESVQYANAINFLENYANNTASYILKPNGWDLELKSNTFDSSKIRETIRSENEEITFAFLANFLNLGSGGGGGSYSLSNDLSDFFTTSLEFIAEEIVETFNNQLIPAMIKLNFPNAECLVELAVSGIADKAGKEFAEVVQLLTSVRAITPDRDLEQALRKKYKLPPMPELGIEDEPVAGQANAEDVQITAFNGAQISSMIEVVTSYRTGILSHESAIAMLKTSFNIDDAKALEIVGPDLPTVKAPEKDYNFAEKKSKKEQPELIVARITSNAEMLKAVFRSGLAPIGKDIIKKLLAKYETKSDAKNHSSVFDIKPTGVNEYNKLLRLALGRIVTDARGAVEANYKFAAGRNSINRALSRADLLVITQERDLEKAIFLQFGSSVDSTDSISTLESDLMIAMDNQLKMIDVGADIVAAQLENETRMDFFDEISDEVESFTFYNADPISEICNELDGATFSINDPDLERYTPPLHHNCKSVMVPNLRGDKTNPKPTGLPSISEAGKKSITLGEKHFSCNH